MEELNAAMIQSFQTVVKEIRSDIDDLRGMMSEVLAHVKPVEEGKHVALPRPVNSVQGLEDLNEKLRTNGTLRKCLVSYCRTLNQFEAH